METERWFADDVSCSRSFNFLASLINGNYLLFGVERFLEFIF